MTTSLGVRDVVHTAQVDLTSTGDTIVLTPGVPIDVLRWGIVADALIDVGAGMTVSLDHRVTAGSDTGRVEIDSFSQTTDIAAGAGVSRRLTDEAAATTAVDGSTVNTGGTSPYEVDPGEQLVFDVDDAADTAGTGYVFIEYLVKPAQGTRYTTTMTETAVT